MERTLTNQIPNYNTKLEERNQNHELIYTKEQRLQSKKDNSQIFDQILKSLETPRATSNNPYDLNGGSKGKFKSRMNELKGINRSNNGIANTKKLIIHGSKKTNFSQRAQTFSNFGSRVASPKNKIFDSEGMKTPSIRNYRGKFAFRDITNSKLGGGDDLEMITSAVPERKSRVYMEKENDISQMSKFQPSNFFAQTDGFSSKSQLKYLPKIPKLEFVEEDETHDFPVQNNHFARVEVPSFDQPVGSMWKKEEDYNPSSYYQKKMLIGKKRPVPEFDTSFELKSEKRTKNRDLYSISKRPKFQKRMMSGVRSTMPERYKPQYEKKQNYDDFALEDSSSNSLFNQSFSLDSDIEMERIKLKRKYEKESRMLMERARKKKMREKLMQDFEFKKPRSKKSKRGAARPPVIKEGDWLCPNQSCCNINWSKRVYCNLCQTKRPHMSAVKKRPYMVTKLYEANTWSCPKCKNIINAAHTFCGICGTTRTRDIEQGLEQVKRHYAKKAKRSKKPKRSPNKIKHEESDTSFLKSEDTRAILDDPYNDGLLELNLRRNFGPGYLTSGNWYRSSEAKR